MAEGKRKSKELDVMRAMPKNIEAERAVLGAALIDREAADDVCHVLTKFDFYDDANAEIFDAMRELGLSNKPIDIVTVCDLLEMRGKLVDVGSVAYLSRLAGDMPSAANFAYYRDIIKRDSMLRRIITAGTDISKIGYSYSDEVKALEDAERAVFRLSEEAERSEFSPISEASARTIDEIERIQSGTSKRNVVYTGFSQFDRLTNGLKGGDFVLLAARPSIGKTAFALNIAANAAVSGHKSVAIFSLEMYTVQLVKRMIAYLSKVNLKDMDTEYALTRADLRNIYQAHEALIASRMFINESGSISAEEILSKCLRLKRSSAGLDLVIIDYLQLLKIPERAESRLLGVTEISRAMKIYAKELGVPFLVLSQMSRAIDQRNEHDPKLSDLRDSGAIEQDADLIAFLHKPSKYDPSKYDPNYLELRVEKNRNGPCETIPLLWDGKTTSFCETTATGFVKPAKTQAPDPSPLGDKPEKTLPPPITPVSAAVPAASAVLGKIKEVASDADIEADTMRSPDEIFNVTVGEVEEQGSKGYEPEAEYKNVEPDADYDPDSDPL
ncbi:MAG: replicative DNA helicase [Christensenellales bacterium]|jgi:replicative DNA helicase